MLKNGPKNAKKSTFWVKNEIEKFKNCEVGQLQTAKKFIFVNIWSKILSKTVFENFWPLGTEGKRGKHKIMLKISNFTSRNGQNFKNCEVGQLHLKKKFTFTKIYSKTSSKTFFEHFWPIGSEGKRGKAKLWFLALFFFKRL